MYSTKITGLGDGFGHTQSRKEVTENVQLHVTQGEKQNSEMVALVTGITLRNDVTGIVDHAQGGAEKVDKPRDSNLVSPCLVDTLSQYSLHGEVSTTEETAVPAQGLGLRPHNK